MVPSNLGYAQARFKALRHDARFRHRAPPPATTGPRDGFDTAKRITANITVRHVPSLIAISTTIRFPITDLASNVVAKPKIGDQSENWQVVD
jgi:hypothetical protein